MVLAETEQGVAQAIIRSDVQFKRDPWPKVSDNAKDLVKKMLDPDPKQRLTAEQVLGKLSCTELVHFHIFYVLVQRITDLDQIPTVPNSLPLSFLSFKKFKYGFL